MIPRLRPVSPYRFIFLDATSIAPVVRIQKHGILIMVKILHQIKYEKFLINYAKMALKDD